MTEPTPQEIETLRKILEVEDFVDELKDLINERTRTWTDAQRTHLLQLQYVQITKAVLYA